PPPVVVGLAGRGPLPDESTLRERLRRGLDQVLHVAGGVPGRSLTVLAPLVEPSERLVAGLLLEVAAGAALHAVLPAEGAPAVKQLVPGQEQPALQALLDRADALVFPPAPPRSAGRGRPAAPGAGEPPPADGARA